MVRYKNGKIAAASGAHDDVVMAYNHVIYVLTYGYDLGRFGIDKSRCTFEKAYEVLNEYEAQEEDKTVNNMLPFDQPTEYEEQLRDELVAANARMKSLDVDEFGYRRNEYVEDGYSYNERQTPQDSLSTSDLNAFASMQSFQM